MRYAWAEAGALSALAGLHRQSGRKDEARACLQELLEVQRRIGHHETALTQKAIAAL
jgi:hypothetical protein